MISYLIKLVFFIMIGPLLQSQDDGGWEDSCSNFNQEECEYIDFCEWIADSENPNSFGMCVEVGPNSDDGGTGGGEDGCLSDDAAWYCIGCELFINDCQYYECTEEGWSDLITIDNMECNDTEYNCSDLSQDECESSDGCQWISDSDNPTSWGGICLEVNEDNSPPECILDCEGIEYINPDENADEACDWIISNFGPNNFFNECAEDCDEETLMELNQLTELCFICLEDEDIGCSEAFNGPGDDGGSDDGGWDGNCSDLNQEDCNYVDYCEWQLSPNGVGMCVEINNDDGAPECILDCPGIEDIDPSENADDSCFWIVSTFGGILPSECAEDCDNETMLGIYELVNACYDCLNNPVFNCSDVFEENDGDDGGSEEYLAYFDIADSFGFPGMVVEVPLYYESLESIAGLQFRISDEPNWFIGVDVISHTCLESNSNDVNGDLIGVLFSLTGCILEPSDSLTHFATLLYEISPNIDFGTTSLLIVEEFIVADSQGNPIPYYVHEGSISIESHGDVTGDGDINILDVVTLINFILFIEVPNDYQFMVGDMNSDQNLDILDIVILVNNILGD